MAQLEFDGLARRELSLTMDDCRLPSNISKNRYRDISPCEYSWMGEKITSGARQGLEMVDEISSAV